MITRWWSRRISRLFKGLNDRSIGGRFDNRRLPGTNSLTVAYAEAKREIIAILFLFIFFCFLVCCFFGLAVTLTLSQFGVIFSVAAASQKPRYRRDTWRAASLADTFFN